MALAIQRAWCMVPGAMIRMPLGETPPRYMIVSSKSSRTSSRWWSCCTTSMAYSKATVFRYWCPPRMMAVTSSNIPSSGRSWLMEDHLFLKRFLDRDLWPRRSPEKGLEDIRQDDLQNVMTTRQEQ